MQRFTVQGHDVLDTATGALALMPNMQTAVEAARQMNAAPESIAVWCWNGARS